VDATEIIPPSFRDRLISYTVRTDPLIHDAFVLAENFKDYFKDNAYTDLLMFEDDIASISTLVIIFLESPGSLVELGMFCNKPEFYKKLIIIAPQEEVSDEDSFIYLGPLEYIRRKDHSSVAIYPWPKPDITDYDDDNIEDLCDIIREKLKLSSKNEKFSLDNSGHKALLIYEIIALCFPILIGEIEISLAAIDIKIPIKTISRYLYLLNKIGLIEKLQYSNYQYYYPTKINQNKIKFGWTKNKLSVDTPKIKMSILETFVHATDPQSKKRKNARKQILKRIAS